MIGVKVGQEWSFMSVVQYNMFKVQGSFDNLIIL